MLSFQIQMLIAQNTNQNVKKLDIVQDYNICIICGAHMYRSSYHLTLPVSVSFLVVGNTMEHN